MTDTPLTNCVIDRVSAEIENPTAADTAIALRNHAYNMERDRRMLIEIVRKIGTPTRLTRTQAQAVLQRLGEE